MDPAIALSPRRMDEAKRARLAERADTPPEVLFFLANDPTTTVRAAIAANAATPPLADQVLSRDTEQGVRRVLARKLASLAPTLDPAATERHRRVTWDTLCRLVEDDAVPVRLAVAELVAEQPDVPRALILRLARDIAMAVAEPVLRGSPLLGESDLLSLIAAPPAPGTLCAIARRPNLPEAPSDAIAARADPPSVAALLANATARLREATLLAIAHRCGDQAAWQAALVRRPALSEAVIRSLQGVLAEEALNVLLARPELKAGRTDMPGPSQAAAADACGMDETGFVSAARRGQLTDCGRILAALCGLPAGVVIRALQRREASLLVALCWKARLSPSTAAFAQLRLTSSTADELLVLPGGAWEMPPERMQALIEGLFAPSAQSPA